MVTAVTPDVIDLLKWMYRQSITKKAIKVTAKQADRIIMVVID